MLGRLLEILLGLPPLSVYGVIAALAATENVFPPVPADAAVALGAFLSTGGAVSAAWVFTVTWCANVSGAIAVYVAARTIGRPFFRGPLGRRLVRPKALERIEHLYRRHGTWGIFVSRFIPGVRAVVPPFAGVAGLTWPRAVIPVVVASGIWYGALTFLAATVVREVDQIAKLLSELNRTGLIILAVLVVGLAAGLILGWRRRQGRGHRT